MPSMQNSKLKEKRILLLCAHVDMREAKIGDLQEISHRDLDWEYLIELALFHRVFPLLYKNIKKHIPETLPDNALKQLKNICMQNGARNLFLVSNLFSVLELFEKHNIPALSFKGPALTENIYGNVTLRSFSDLDILISRTDLNKAVLVLQEQGFHPDINLDPKQFLKLADKGHHAVLIKDSVVVELHWELTGRYFSKNITIESVSPRMETIPLTGKSLTTLGAEDLLIYLCIHGCRHHWIQLDAVCCIAELINKKTTLDWELIYQLAEKQGALKMTLLGLLLAQKLLDLVLPIKVEKKINRYQKLDSIAYQITEKMFFPPEESQQLMNYREYVLFHYAIMDKRIDWLAYCIKPLLNTTHSDWQWVRLPASLSFLYYILRPLRLISTYSNKLFR